MKRLAITMTFLVVSCCVSYGQEATGPNSEHLNCFGPMIGTWQYEGPLLDTVPDFAEKGTKILFQFSWKRILNKSVVEENRSIAFEGGKKFAGKALIGWNAAENQLTYGGMDSLGGMSLGTVTFDEAAKTSTLTENGIDGNGKKTEFKGVVTKTGKDTLTWQALVRVGGVVEGPSQIYNFKRVERAKRNKPAK
jgi:hypothetical protein